MHGKLTSLFSALRNLIDSPGETLRFDRQTTDLRAWVSWLAPHLTIPEVSEYLKHVIPETNGVQFICPATAIRGAEHVCRLSYEEGQVCLTYQRCFRTWVSYPRRATQQQFAPVNHLYSERCADFAETHWGNELQWDASVGHLQCNFQAPPGVLVGELPTVLVALTTPLECIQDTPSTPSFTQMARHHFMTTNNPVVIRELLGQLNATQRFYCAACGGYLTDRGCAHCEREWDTGLVGPRVELPLPPLVVEACPEYRRWIPEDPIHAIKAAYGKFSRDGYICPPTAHVQGPRERVVELRSDE